ncbi:unnamed protein product, partial [Medioppia subpectinata]
AGDVTEVNAIYNAYCKPTARTEPLPVGSLKGNIGHTEGAAGLCGLIKLLIVYENERIPPCRNLHQLRDDLAPLLPFIKPVVKVQNYTPGLAAVNSFNIAGANAHVLLEPNYKLATSDGHQRVADIMPRIVNICGRSEAAVNHIMNFIENNPNKISNDFLALLTQTMNYKFNVNSSGFPFRGSTIMTKMSNEINNETKYKYKRHVTVMADKTIRPLWVLFLGLGGQWPAMARALMPVKRFADTIDECHQIVSKEFGIDLKHILLSEDKTAIATMTAKFVATTAVEVALFAVIKELGITPDGIIGHSFGEIACAFADGCLTVNEAIAVSAIRGVNSVQNANIPKGLMAVVGLSRAQALKYCQNEVYIACNNANNNVVISGPINEMLEIMKQLKSKGVFVRPLDCDEIPYHSPYVSNGAKAMREAIDRRVPVPKLRSPKWLSTSVLTNTDGAFKYCDGGYFEYNLVNEVRFHDRLQTLPADAVVLELGPHSVFRQIVAETLPNAAYIALLKKDSNETNMDMFLSGLAQLYGLGFNMSIDRLYPRVEWPVPRGTPSIASLIQWDHRQQYYVTPFVERYFKSTSADSIVTIGHLRAHDSFYLEHKVDGRAVVPAAGHLMFMWRRVAASVGKLWTQCPVVFENIHFKRAVYLSDTCDTKLVIKYYPPLGDELCVTGRARTTVGDAGVATIDTKCKSVLITQESIDEWEPRVNRPNTYTIDRADIYRDFRALALEYGPAFQRLRSIETDDFRMAYGRCEWTGNPVTFMDALCQSMALMSPHRQLIMPVMIRSLRIDPRVLFDGLRARRLPVRIGQFNEQITHSDNSKADNLDEFDERYAKYSVDMPFRYNTVTKQLVAPGIEMEGIAGQPIPGRHETGVTVESYEFCANNDMTAIDDSMSAKVSQYIKPGGERLRYIFHCDNNTTKNINSDIASNIYLHMFATDLMANVIKGGVVGTYRHLKLANDYDKCVSNDYYFNMGQTRGLSGLKWFDASKLSHSGCEFNDNCDHKTRVDIYYAGVSFRDVMLATGRLPCDTDLQFTDCFLGNDFVGRRTDTGQRVMGFDCGRCLATSINLLANRTIPVPDHWSMAEAATIMNVYFTVYYSLIRNSLMKKGETILIHSAAGGVGQAAINVCQHYGCDIYATVGTDEKRRFLMNEYNIPADRILGSRDIRFKSAVMEGTGGRGVDIVLNSLAGELLTAGFECLADGGRFVELGKSDLVHNGTLDRRHFTRGLQYVGVAVDRVLNVGPEIINQFADWLRDECCLPADGRYGCVRPLAYKAFAAADAGAAFQYMTTGRHIGKVIVKLRDEEPDRGPLIGVPPAPTATMMVYAKTFFNPHKVFIITGGLGAIGLELFPWMHYRGARKFVLNSRSGLSDNYKRYFINRFKHYFEDKPYFKCDLFISTANALTINGATQLLAEALGLGPIGGVFHLAFVMNESLYENMSWDRFDQTVAPKHRALANLDQLTRQLDYHLDYFVFYSSQATGKGLSGLANYGYGNSVCERLCERRRADGLHALAVQYGLVGDVGAGLGYDYIDLVSACRKQSVRSACDVLDTMLAIDNPVLTSQVFNDNRTVQSTGKAGSRLVAELWTVMGVDPNTTPSETTLGEIGLESMFAIQLQQEFKESLELNATFGQIKCLTVCMFKTYAGGDHEPIRKQLLTN